mmetsp:Transcript_21779/g.74880  ORF Transcript_21779/g.74880 Transcript_21779/m.74880 type:complete len:279 (+) Transcript_21779:2982-3818(+)
MLLEALGAVYLKLPRHRCAAAGQRTELRGGAPHVERQDKICLHLTSDILRKHHTACGTGLHEAHRQAGDGVRVREAAAGGHEQQGAAETGRAELRLRVLQVARHQRLDIRVHRSCAESLVLPRFRAHRTGRAKTHAGQQGAEDGGRTLLVRAVRVAVQEADRDAFDACLLQLGGQCLDGRLIQRLLLGAVREHPLAHREAQPPRHQRRRARQRQVMSVVAAPVADVQDVAEAFGCEHRRLRPSPLQHRIGRQGRAVQEQAHLLGTFPCCLQRSHGGLQ